MWSLNRCEVIKGIAFGEAIPFFKELENNGLDDHYIEVVEL